MNCRFCKSPVHFKFLDLGSSPPSNSFLTREQLSESEPVYPLSVHVCEKCFLVQIDEFKKAEEIFTNEYVYFSSFSKSWLAHAKAYVEMMVSRFSLGSSSRVIEIASNDGYLLQYFKEKGVPVLGVEPTANTAAEAKKKGIESVVDFFGIRTAKEISKKGKADLLLGNNVLAHVPDINDFVAGMKLLLADQGVITMEFPHVMQLIQLNQFDTVYHEHYSYLSLYTVKRVFQSHNLDLFDVEELPTHGGSLRIFATHKGSAHHPITGRVQQLEEAESKFGIDRVVTYKGFQERAERIRHDLLSFLKESRQTGKKVLAYGAAAKGNTLLNFCRIGTDLISAVADASTAKQGKFLPGSHIPVITPEALKAEKPDFVLIFPWNIQEEVKDQLSYIAEWGGKFVTAIPKLTVS